MDYSSSKLEYEKHWPCNIRARNDRPAIEPTASGLIDDIMKKYFCQKAGQGSSCSLFSYPKGSVYSMDRRLLYWSQILEDRKRIACRIQRLTGKRLSHVLYNQIEEHRNVQNVKRVIDIGQRLDPTHLSSRKTDDIKNTLFETLPRSERLQTPNFEIVGTPKVTMAEQWLHNCSECNNSFLRSSYLQRKLKSTATGVNVLEFYPDIDRLQVVGRRIPKHMKPMAEIISDFELSVLSSTPESFENAEFPEFCLRIDDTVLRGDFKLAKNMTFCFDLMSTPFRSTTQTICQIKNIGKKPVHFQIRRVKPSGSAYLPPFKKVFRFNVNAIRLGYAESVEIQVTFLAEDRLIQEDHYYLITEPNFFEDNYKIIFKLTGECHMPHNYYNSIIGDLLDSVVNNIIAETVCDTLARKKVILSERETFEKQNPGLKCEPQDLRKFYEIYRQTRRKYHPNQWDMNLQGLKEIIEGVPDYTQRSAYLELFIKTIREMRRRIPCCDTNLKTLLARTVILANFEKWEKKALKIKRAVAGTDLDLLIIKMPFDTVIEQIKLCKTDREKRQIILHNALFIQMYCTICEMAEDVASYVENCLKLYACC